MRNISANISRREYDEKVFETVYDRVIVCCSSIADFYFAGFCIIFPSEGNVQG